MKKIIYLTSIFSISLLITGCVSGTQKQIKNIDENDNSTPIDNEEIVDDGINTNDKFQIELQFDSNYAEGIEKSNSDFSLGCYVVDLDRDGNEEAFVVEGFKDEWEEETFAAYKMWFVDENKQYYELDDLFIFGECVNVLEVQYAKEIDGRVYFIINGQSGAEGVGVVYTVVNDELKNSIEMISCAGQKGFSDDDLIWYKEIYGMSMQEREGTTLTDTAVGRCFMPYHLYVEDGECNLYDAKEISDDAEELSKLPDIDDIKKNALDIQFILRDNNELDVNYVEKDGDEYIFKANVYMYSDENKDYEFQETVDGFFAVDVNNYSSWDFFDKK